METTFSIWIGENYGRIGLENASTSSENTPMRSVRYTHPIVESAWSIRFGCTRRINFLCSGFVVDAQTGFGDRSVVTGWVLENRSVEIWVDLSSETEFWNNTIISKASNIFGIQSDVHRRAHNHIDRFQNGFSKPIRRGIDREIRIFDSGRGPFILLCRGVTKLHAVTLPFAWNRWFSNFVLWPYTYEPVLVL